LNGAAAKKRITGIESVDQQAIVEECAVTHFSRAAPFAEIPGRARRRGPVPKDRDPARTLEMPMKSHRPSLALAALFAGFLAAPATAQVAIADPWVRGTVPGQSATGAFMQLTATSDLALVAAASPVAKVVEIHEMRMEGGMMKMSAVERLPLPANKRVELKPGGYHVMLMGLAQPLKEGEAVPITLTFADAAGKKQSVEVKAPVRPLTASK
jgi:copper(I)-binding protein